MPKGNLPQDPERRGRVIAAREGWVQRAADEGVYYVRDLATGRMKLVNLSATPPDCSCGVIGGGCEHVCAAKSALEQAPSPEVVLQFVTEEWNSPELQQAYRKGQEAEFRLFDPLLKSLMDMVPDPPRPASRPGTKPTPIGEALFTAVQKAHLGLSLSRVKGLFASDLEHGWISRDWNYSLPSRVLARRETTPLLIWAIKEVAKPLAFLEEGGTVAIDSSGLTTSAFGAYYPQAHEVTPRREFIKIHVAVLTRTNVVADVVVTDSRGADSPQFIPLLQGTVDAGFRPEYAVADKAYLARRNLQAAVDLGIKPRIPFKENSTAAAHGCRVWSSLYHLAQVDPMGYADAYHQRSNVESTFSALKRLLDESVYSKGPITRLNEALCKILAYNLLTLIRHFVARGVDLSPLFKTPPRSTRSGEADRSEPSLDEADACESFGPDVKSSDGAEG